MDFNFESKLWAEKICQQFESICQDVDGFVNKETMKFVGNQVQSVGMSVKRLYSDVVPDILPFSGDTAKPRQQLTAGEQLDMQETSKCADEIKLAKNQVTDDHKMRISKPDGVPEAQTCQNVREQSNSMVQNSEGSTSAEMNVTTHLKPVTASSSFEGELFSAKSDEDIDISSSPAFAAHEEGSTSIEKETRDFNHQKGDEGFSDDTMCLSDTLSTAWLSESKLPTVEDPYLDVNRSLSSPQMPVLTHKVNQDNCPLMDSPLPPACDVDDRAQDLSTSVQSSEHVFSYSCDEKEELMAIMPSTSCTFPKSSITTESTSADFSEEAENVLHSRSVSDCCTYNISAASSIKFDNNALHTDRSDFERGHEQHYKNSHSKVVTSPSETENTYGLDVPIGDLDLENVDLSSNVKHDGRNVILCSNFAAGGSYKRKNFRYYKKLIQGAFTSRKRLTKEYEHLAIMYGDIDVESNQHFEPSSLSSFPGIQSSQETSENEWELL